MIDAELPFPKFCRHCFAKQPDDPGEFQDSRIVLTNSELVERGETTNFDSTDEQKQTKRL